MGKGEGPEWGDQVTEGIVQMLIRRRALEKGRGQCYSSPGPLAGWVLRSLQPKITALSQSM